MSAEAEMRGLEMDPMLTNEEYRSRRIQQENDEYALLRFEQTSARAKQLLAEIGPKVQERIDQVDPTEVGRQILAAIAKAETEQRVRRALMGSDRWLTLPQRVQKPELVSPLGSDWDNAEAINRLALQIWERVCESHAGWRYTPPRSEASAARNGEMPTGDES